MKFLPFIFIPLAAVSFGGLQMAEIFLLLFFIYELIQIKKIKVWIFVISIICFYYIIGDVSISALSQIIKAMLLPLLYVRFSQIEDHKKINMHEESYFVSILILFMLLSIPLGFRLPVGSYLDADAGFFRHSVDTACFIIMSIYYFTRHSKLPLYFSSLFILPVLFLGGSRTILGLVPMYFLLKRPVLGLTMIIILFIAIFLFFDIFIFLGDLGPSSAKIFSFMELVSQGGLNAILFDGSILIRIENFKAIFDQMSGIDWIFGMQREDIISIASATSNGDVSTDNIILYKIIYFGLPFGIMIPIVNFFSLWKLTNEISLLMILLAYGMLQDWLSNGFGMYIIYTFLILNNSLISNNIKNLKKDSHEKSQVSQN